MANIKLIGNTWDTSSIYDATQQKTQKQINIDDINANIQLNDRLTDLDGGVYPFEFELGQRYISNGVETYGTNTIGFRLKQGLYIKFKAGDIVGIKSTRLHTFRCAYTSDEGQTWTGGSGSVYPVTIERDSIGFICIEKRTGVWTIEEMNQFIADGKIIIIREARKVETNTNNIFGLLDGSDNFGSFKVCEAKSGITYQWASAGVTAVVTSAITNGIEAIQGDLFSIKGTLSIVAPELYTAIGFIVYELNSGGSTVTTHDITNFVTSEQFSITGATTTQIKVCCLLRANSTSITEGYVEVFDYQLSVTKSTGISGVLTESGDAWEV